MNNLPTAPEAERPRLSQGDSTAPHCDLPATNAEANPVHNSSRIGPSVPLHTAPFMRVVLISLSTITLFYSLGEQLLRTWDESIYAEVAKEMLTRHSWWTLSWNFEPWVDKPPLFMWLTALLYRFFGVSETSSRAV